jgi:hypothetical protein
MSSESRREPLEQVPLSHPVVLTKRLGAPWWLPGVVLLGVAQLAHVMPAAGFTCGHLELHELLSTIWLVVNLSDTRGGTDCMHVPVQQPNSASLWLRQPHPYSLPSTPRASCISSLPLALSSLPEDPQRPAVVPPARHSNIAAT